MTRTSRRELATRVVLIYWLTLIGGLALFTATRAGDPAVTTSLWIGAVGGTLVGQYLALHDFRLWIAALTIAAAGIYCGPLLPSGEASTQLWQAFIPAALCGFWSLGDRAVLAAAWFPTVIWMLTILDRSDRIAPDGAAAILLGGLAGLFIWFLAARESRRVALWRSVAAEPLAAAEPPELLREPPGRQLARAGWWLSVGALTVAITVWLAPPLWQSETLGGPVTQLVDDSFVGPRCCPVNDADTRSSRIKEYLGLGLGHGEHTAAPLDGADCRDCRAPVPQARPGAVAAAGPAGDAVVPWSGHVPAPGRGVTIDVGGERGDAWSGAMPARGGSVRVRAGWSPLAPEPSHGDQPAPVAPGAPNPPAPDPIVRSIVRSIRRSIGLLWLRPGGHLRGGAVDLRSGGRDRRPGDRPAPGRLACGPRSVDRLAGGARRAEHPGAVTGTVTGARRHARRHAGRRLDPAARLAARRPDPGRPGARARSGPGHTAARRRHRPPHRPLPRGHRPRRPVAPALAGVRRRRGRRVPARPPRAAAGPPPGHAAPPPPPVLGRDHRPARLQLVAARAGRPARRRLAHRPGEPPRELARRVSVDGLDRCAAILERARHGVGLDAGDLGEMQTSADAAYRAARTGLGGVARALGWLRWPLT